MSDVPDAGKARSRRKVFLLALVGVLSICLVATSWRISEAPPYAFLEGSNLLRARIDAGAPGGPAAAFLVYSVERPIAEVLPAARSELGGSWSAVNFVPAPGATYRRLSEANVEDLGCPVPTDQRWLRLKTDYQGCSLSTPSLSVSIELFDTLTNSEGRSLDYPAPSISAEAVVIIVRQATTGDRIRAVRDWLSRRISDP